MSLRSHLDGALFADHTDGVGPPVVALHGWGRDRGDLAVVVADRQAIAFDLPGHGSSPPPPSAWGAAEYASAVADVLDEIGGGPFVVLGHSFGGRVACYLAADRPDLVGAVVFAGVPLLRVTPSSGPSLSFRLLRAAHRRGLIPDAKMEQIRQKRGSADYRAAQGVMRDVLVRVVGETYEEPLRRIDCPVGFCWGAEDSAAPAEVARRASEMVKRSVACEILDGVRHDVHREAPEAVRRVLVATQDAAVATGTWQAST